MNTVKAGLLREYEEDARAYRAVLYRLNNRIVFHAGGVSYNADSAERSAKAGDAEGFNADWGIAQAHAEEVARYSQAAAIVRELMEDNAQHMERMKAHKGRAE